ncbi:MAG: hypothetical protein JXA82_15775 [Sedimentisphaerales bacterium]|nr:hypothetical protein [Sedimentisphaerales bacterium]
MKEKKRLRYTAIAILLLQMLTRVHADLASDFRDPPDSARPGVYWYIMDGNLRREGITADLESMKEAGIGHVIFLEVNVGVPRGPVDFLSEPWQELFVHAVREAERLGIEITLGSGPGWAGSGGPWVKPEQSMQHLVASSVQVSGPTGFNRVLPLPETYKPYFEGAVTGKLIDIRNSFYSDVALLAFPTPKVNERIEDIDEKALYYRAPYTSCPGVKPYLPALSEYPTIPSGAAIEPRQVIDLASQLKPDGRLQWDVPPGDWTIMRFGRRNNGATTRPAPNPGFGFECDKFDSAALDAHFEAYVGKLLKKVGYREKGRGWTMLHIDSWEMGAQNWTGRFREEFHRRRGYELLPFLPVYTGRFVGSQEISERFLWDVRLTAQELVIENHAEHLKELGQRYDFRLSIEPYDMNPTSDLDLGSVADVPMCEFWSDGFGFDSSFSCIEATSIAHVLGKPVMAAEAFTANHEEAWKLYPGTVKNQGDWAFCAGINHLVYHTFAHKPYGRRPGMTMGPYGVHWDRGQTWWPMVADYHKYITRCQYLLRQGHSVADICYLIPEGAPHVFRPPLSALAGHGSMRDRRGYNFDGCSPNTLIANASVEDGRLKFPGGARYRLLVLPSFDTMTPNLLRKVRELVEAGATVVGPPPRKSPSLMNYPQCDEEVASLAIDLWGQEPPPDKVKKRLFRRGRIFWGGDLLAKPVGDSASRPIEQAHWIWYPEGYPAASVEPSQRYFRHIFHIDSEKQIHSAQLEITADNSFQVWINGVQFTSGSNFHTIYTMEVKSSLKPGINVLAVAATNAGDSPNPAGLIAAVYLVYKDGSTLIVPTDDRWQAASEVKQNSFWWASPQERWKNAKKLGPFDMDPWKLQTDVVEPCPELYPDYDSTVRLLAEIGVIPDFETDGPIRYTHRRTEEWDLYFVANREAKAVEAVCAFRITGRPPQLWDPLTGEIHSLAKYTEQKGFTTIPIRFEPHQSFFIMFSKQSCVASSKPPVKTSFTKLHEISRIEGPWDVSFDPSLGGPKQVKFTTLEDWTHSPENKIKYYSGIATYRTTFDLPERFRLVVRPILLDLGKVHNMARVRLNGHDLGMVWCSPWRIDITDAVQQEKNRLEIDVANLWINRLIGDKILPAGQQVAWTTFNPYQQNSPLTPSGLIGPVTLQTMKAYPGDYLWEICEELKKPWPSNRTINIVCHGHSVPAGYFKTPEVDTFHAYPHLLHRGLKERFPYAVINVIVTAIGGEDSESGAKRFERDVLSVQPDVILIDYGLNDRRIGLAQAKVAWQKMISLSQAAGSKVILLTPTPDVSANLDDPNDSLNLHAEQIRQLAHENGIALVDSLVLFKEFIHSGKPLKTVMSQSNHPNQKGHEIVDTELLKWFP